MEDAKVELQERQWSESMRFKLWEPAPPSPKQDPFQWHRYYCWRPLIIRGTIIWLETVYRKAVDLGYKTYEGKTAWVWEYNIEGSELDGSNN